MLDSLVHVGVDPDHAAFLWHIRCLLPYTENAPLHE